MQGLQVFKGQERRFSQHLSYHCSLGTSKAHPSIMSEHPNHQVHNSKTDIELNLITCSNNIQQENKKA